MSSNDPRGTHPIGVRIVSLFVTGHEGEPKTYYYPNTKQAREALRRADTALRPTATQHTKRRYIPRTPKRDAAPDATKEN